MISKTKAKNLRRKWWLNLTPTQQETQIRKWQIKKAKKRAKQPVKIQESPEINSENKDEWLKKIHKKNPWLKIEV